jgi:hypothetical protein
MFHLGDQNGMVVGVVNLVFGAVVVVESDDALVVVVDLAATLPLPQAESTSPAAARASTTVPDR